MLEKNPRERVYEYQVMSAILIVLSSARTGQKVERG